MQGVRFFWAAALSAILGLAAVPAAFAQADGSGYMQLSAADAIDKQPIYLGVNKSIVVDLPRAAGDVLVSNPQVADAVLRTSTRLYLIGVSLGQASVFLFDGAGQQITSLDIYVEADLSTLNQLLAEAIPDGFVRADALNGSIILRGQVSSATDALRAVDITSKMLGPLVASISTATTALAGGTSGATTQAFDPTSGAGIVNLITISGQDQVTLKVTIAEVQRSVVKQLGINMTGGFNGNELDIGTDVAGANGFGTSPLVPSLGIVGSAGEIGLGFSAGNVSIGATLRALEEANMIRTLAEPNLTAVSGETANFLAGGEFGYQTINFEDDDDGTTDARVLVQFKPFGVELAFTPNVLDEGRISLKLATSVSEISGTTFGIPSLNTRKAETTVELPSGGSFVIGGLLQETTRRFATGFPGLQHIPILGALFASKGYLSSETELVMIVTAYLVKPTSPKALARPDENLAMSGDAEAYLLNQLTKVYGRASDGPGTPASAQVGFTFD